MTRAEIIDLLEILISCYPNTKIADPSAMATSWEMVLGEYEASSIYKAARLQMSISPFFPKPADLINSIERAELVYSPPPRPVLKPTTSAKVTAIPDNDLDEFLDSIWDESVKSEREMHPNESDPVDSQTLGGALPYET